MSESLAFSVISAPGLTGETTAAQEIKRILVADIRESRHSREELAAELSRLLGRSVTRASLDAYTAETKPHHFPADMVSAWVRVTGSRRLLAAICESSGLCLATQTDREFAELGRTRLKDEKLSRRLWEKV